VTPAVLAASLPAGSLVAAIMAVNNHRDALSDRTANVRTLSNVLGFRAENLGTLTPWTFLAFLERSARLLGVPLSVGAALGRCSHP
jgi:1,4-dihydroxy-2-naphthoate octaprenyltransferase